MSVTPSGTFVGIDVSKRWLEVAVHESEYHCRCLNKESAFGELIAELIALQPERIVLEATGGLEIAVTAALYAAGLPVVVINPRQVRDFAKALGFKSPQSISILGKRRRQDLDCNIAIELLIRRTVHLTHPTRANLRADFVAAEFCAWDNGHETRFVLPVPRRETTSWTCGDRSAAILD